MAFTWSATPKDAGTYTLTATIPETANTEKAKAALSVTIGKAALTVTDATIATRTYQPDNTDAAVSGVTFTGLANGETLALGTDYTATGTFADANAGENKSVTVTVALSSDGEKAKNYEISGTFTTASTIDKAGPVVTDVSVSGPATIYESAALSDITLTHNSGDTPGTVELIAGQTLTIETKEYNWTFAPTDANNYNTTPRHRGCAGS